MAAEHIVYEDPWLIAIDKPAGMASQTTRDDASSDAVTQLRGLLAERDGRAPYLALHHRLDLGTSGTLLLARHRSANRGLGEAFAGRRISKLYHALSAIDVPEPPRCPLTLTDRLLRTTVDGRRRVVVDASGQEAITEIRPFRRFAEVVWLEARPKTGRTHQVRAHLAAAGLPVLGDLLYGDRTAPRLMLHAARLELEHPVTGLPLTIESPLPEDFLCIARSLEKASS